LGAEIRNKTQIECIDGLEIELSARTDLVLIVEAEFVAMFSMVPSRPV
jgi:hypothetical protein